MSSPRRGGNDESILAMLERDGMRGAGRASPSASRLVWYGGGGVLVVCLVGLLAWLARDNTGQPPGEPAVQPAVVEATPARIEAGSQHAAIIDQTPAPAHQQEPPLVLLSPPEQGSAEEAPRPTHAAVVVDEKPVAAVAARTEAAVHEVAPKPAVAVAAIEQPAAKHEPAAPAPAAARPSEPKHAAKASHEGPRAHSGKKVAAARAAQHGKPAAKPKKPAAAARAAEAPAVDSDVALISAVIQHSAKHGANGCDGDAGCAAKATTEP